MSDGAILRRFHPAAGAVAFLTLLVFLVSTIAAELFGSHDGVVAVKKGVLWGMLILVPALLGAGASGLWLARQRTSELAQSKRRRLRMIAFKGLLVLLPSASFLAHRASEGKFDAAFYAVQAVEVVTGTASLVMIGLNVRDGLKLSGRSS